MSKQQKSILQEQSDTKAKEHVSQKSHVKDAKHEDSQDKQSAGIESLYHEHCDISYTEQAKNEDSNDEDDEA